MESSRNKSRVELNPVWGARLQFALEAKGAQRLDRRLQGGWEQRGRFAKSALHAVVETQDGVFPRAGQEVGVAPEEPGAARPNRR